MRKTIALALTLVMILSAVCFADGSWTCPSCGQEGNTGKFCSECGTKKPDDTWTCAVCGKNDNTNKFCEECGSAKGTVPQSASGPVNMADFNGVSIGDSVFFGHYEQDGNTNNGAEPIEWIVLNENGGKYLLISYYVLDAKPFHTACTAVKWSQSSLRTWLNGGFYDNAFSSEEKEKIQTTSVYTSPNPYYPKIWSGFTSNDNVFLLSMDEALQYFSSDWDRVGFPTEKAVQDGILMNSDYSVWWWLRTPGNRDYAAVGVYGDGSIYQIGDDVNRDINGVRPVIWVDPNGTAPEPKKNSIEVGQTYYFGSYEQNGYRGDGAEGIAWRVLDIKNGKALLLSEYVLDAYYYNNLANAVTWEDCTLRVWLNNNFYSTAFNSSEKQRIVESAITAEANPTNTYAMAGNNTRDRVFILSASEVNKYLTGNYERAAYGTDYAFGNGLYNNDMLGSTWWWVRTPGKTNKWAVRVLSTGEMVYDGTYVNSDNGGVRPAIWITVE